MYLCNNKNFAALCHECNSNFKNAVIIGFTLKDSCLSNLRFGNTNETHFCAYCPVCRSYNDMSFVENEIADAVSILSNARFNVIDSSSGYVHKNHIDKNTLCVPYISIGESKNKLYSDYYKSITSNLVNIFISNHWLPYVINENGIVLTDVATYDQILKYKNVRFALDELYINNLFNQKLKEFDNSNYRTNYSPLPTIRDQYKYDSSTIHSYILYNIYTENCYILANQLCNNMQYILKE